MDKYLCDDQDPRWISLPSEVSIGLDVESLFPHASPAVAKELISRSKVEIRSEDDFNGKIREMHKLSVVLQYMARREAEAHAFYHPLRLMTFRYTRLEKEDIETWMIFRVHKKEALLELGTVSKNLHETLVLTQPTEEHVELVTKVISDLARNKYLVPTLRYFGALFKEVRYARSDSGAYRGVSLEGLTQFMMVDEVKEYPLPLSDLITDMCAYYGRVTMLTEFEDPKLIKPISVRFPDSIYTSKKSKISGKYLVQRVIQRDLEFFEAVLGRGGNIKRIDVDNETLRSKFFGYLLDALPMGHAHYAELQQEDSKARKMWLIALEFIADMIFDHGAEFFSMLAEWMGEKKAFLFEGFAPFGVSKFAIINMGFSNPKKLPDSLYPY